MAITPNSVVHLLNVPLENDYKNQIYFDNVTDQYNYFRSKVIHTFDNLTYQRKDNVIRVNRHIDDLYNCNYVMYQNTNYTNKWFYAFITKMEYKTDECTLVYIETDVYQTWLKDVTIKASFVEREHVMDDEIGKHTIPEGLETGPFVMCKNPTKVNHYESGTYICIAVTEVISEVTLTEEEEKRQYNGVYSGLYYLVCMTPAFATNLIKIYDKKGKADVINSVFLIPKEFIYNVGDLAFKIGQSEDINYTFAIISSSTGAVNLLRDDSLTEIQYKEISINTTLGGGYPPKNKKLFTGEYNYMVLTNNAGGDVTLNYEDFNNNKPQFKVVGSITPGCSCKCIPVNYKSNTANQNIDNTYNYGLMGAKFPICSWNSDTFTNWLTQNGVNMVVGAVTSGIVSGAGGAALSVVDSLTQVYQHSKVPDQARGNTNSGDITYSCGNSVFTIYQMCIKEEYARKLDNYFEMYGYKVNELKVPNVSGRPHWNYVKTININIDGAIPNEDMETLKSMYDNGVTLWRNGSEVGNYTLNNH